MRDSLRSWILLLAAPLALAGCECFTPVTSTQTVYRGEVSLEPLPNHPQTLPAPVISEPILQATSRGRYTFQLPPEVVEVVQTTPTARQFLLYLGTPQPQDKPVVTLTLAPEVFSESQRGFLKATQSRVYLLNGLITQEWTGYTPEKYPYSELILRTENGDQLHALAIAREPKARQVALAILASIRWQTQTSH